MKFYDLIKKDLNRSAFFQEFDGIIREKVNGNLFFHLNRSLKALLLSRACQESGKNVLMICADDKLAEEYLDDLQLLVGDENAFMLPDYEILPYEERSPHYTIRAERIRTLSRVFSDSAAIYTVSIRSLLRKIVAPEIFSRYVVKLKHLMEYSPDKLVSDLVGMGYDNVFQVSKVGELARRGGIIDVFSPNHNQPLRLDFFGDNIESMRYFDLGSQRSTSLEIEQLTLIPSREFSLHDITGNEYFWEKIHEKGFYEGIEQDVSLLLSKVSSFLDYFQEDNVILFWDEYQFFSSTFKEIQEEVLELFLKARGKHKSEHLADPENIFFSKSYVQRVFSRFQNYFISNSFQEFKRINVPVEVPAYSQESQHNNLENLEIELNQRLEDGYRIIIQSDNQSQSKRMRDLLENLEGNIGFTLGVFQKGFVIPDARLAVYTDHEIFARYRRRSRSAHFSSEEALVDYESLKPGDFIVHIDYGVGIYKGLKKMPSGVATIDCLTIGYAENDVVYVPTFQLDRVSKFVGEEGLEPTIHKLGGKMWALAKSRARKQIELIAEDLVQLYAERQLRKGVKFETDTSWQQDMENAFIYEITPDQLRSTNEIKQDMESEKPMERLLCGDVGYGKTEVAIRAAFKAVMSGYQVAILAPTTLLTDQHYNTFKERLAQYPIRVAMLSRFRSKVMLDKDILEISKGDIDIVIGTHRLLSKDIKFQRLGLLIIDEEHRFGVRHKDKLRQLKSNVDTLYMSATPIPRTMSMALSRLKEMSLIRTSPKARLPIRTVIVPFDEDVIKDAINREIDRGGQVFFVHNRVQTIGSMADKLRKMLPHVRFSIGHGQLPEKQLEAVMLDFAEHKFDVLIASTIIESGIDIPNANTIIINRADTFGLAQLYQIRGRSGRSNRRAYAYLIIPTQLTEIARKRLETLTEYESLGSGYQIAMRDLEIRGAGTLLGTKQSGTINSIGYNYYNRLLENAIENISSGKTSVNWDEDKEAVKRDISIADNFYIPENYIADEKVRLDIYRRIIRFTTEKEFDDLPAEFSDRFGKMPLEAENTLALFRLKMLMEKTGLKKCHIRDKKLIMEFPSDKLPSRSLLTTLVTRFSYPVRFETVHDLKMIFDLAKEDKSHFGIALAVVREILDKA
ncbi:MAG: transcription-repair coupling factor [Candidatus Cloacimonetes bacterium]|nr:transcription-repair coupling factor [Candidatus Cloacimonadota bacterium]